MTFELNIPATIAVVAIIIAVILMLLEHAFTAVLFMLVALVSVITYCENRPEKIAERRAEAEAARRAAIPHVIREADGCKVYEFTAYGKTHFFTRCADSVTTDRNYEVKKSCGKNCTKTEQHTETIVTKAAP
jgi:hypothetical protein